MFRAPSQLRRRQWTALLALVFVAGLLALAAWRMHADEGDHTFEGPFTVELPDQRPPSTRTVTLPVNLRSLGARVDDVVVLRATIPLDGSMDAPAILLRGLRYAAAVSWDGVPFGEVGDLHGPGGDSQAGADPYSHSVVFAIPVSGRGAGLHELRIDIRGAYGLSGLSSPMVFAEERVLRDLHEASLLLAALLWAMLSVAGAAALTTALLRPEHQEFFWYGQFCVALAALVFAQSDLWWLISDSLSLQLRGQALANAWAVATGAAFMVRSTGQGRTRVLDGLTLGCALTAGVTLLWPSGTAAQLMVAATGILSVIASGYGITLAARAVRQRVRGVPALLVATMVLVLASAAGQITAFPTARDPAQLAGVFFYIVTTVAALAIRHVDTGTWYARLVEMARDGIVVAEADGHLVECNPAAAALLGSGRPPANVLRSLVPADRELGRRHLASEAPEQRAELRIQAAADRVVHVESHAAPLPDGRKLLVLRDITSRRAVESSLVHAARMETAGTLSSGIAHDVNNALGALMAHIELLRMAPATAEAQGRLERMESIVQRAGHMTRRLLAIARGAAEPKSPLDVSEVVRDACDLATPLLSATVRLQVEIEPGLPRVLASPAALEQALLNLILNARDALQLQGGEVRVSAARDSAPGEEEGVVLRVEDDGPGVPEALRDRIWEPLFTTKPEGRGTGLGLSVVARVAREHGGSVTLVPRQGSQGACFELRLPPLNAAATLPPDIGVPASRALVVDDDPDIRELVRVELQSRGCAVSTAGDLAAARAIRAGRFDLIVVDVVLPDGSGLDLARALSGAPHPPRVLVISGFIPSDEPTLDPAWSLLSKPFTSEQLHLAVRRLMLAPGPRP